MLLAMSSSVRLIVQLSFVVVGVIMFVILSIAELAKRKRRLEHWRRSKARKESFSESRREPAPPPEVEAQAAALRAELMGVDLDWVMPDGTLLCRADCGERVDQLGKSFPPTDGRPARKYISYGMEYFDLFVMIVWGLFFFIRIAGANNEQIKVIFFQMAPFLLGPPLLMRIFKCIAGRLSDAAGTRQECMECHTTTRKVYRVRITLGSFDAILRILRAEVYSVLPNFVRKVDKSPGRMTIVACPECGSAYVLLDMRVDLVWHGKRREHVVEARWPCARAFIPAPTAQAVLGRLGINAAFNTPAQEPNG